MPRGRITDALAYCDEAYQNTSDTNFGKRVRLAGLGNNPTETTRGAVLMFNTTHDNEHCRVEDGREH